MSPCPAFMKSIYSAIVNSLFPPLDPGEAFMVTDDATETYMVTDDATETFMVAE